MMAEETEVLAVMEVSAAERASLHQVPVPEASPRAVHHQHGPCCSTPPSSLSQSVLHGWLGGLKISLKHGITG